MVIGKIPPGDRSYRRMREEHRVKISGPLRLGVFALRTRSIPILCLRFPVPTEDRCFGKVNRNPQAGIGLTNGIDLAQRPNSIVHVTLNADSVWKGGRVASQ